MSHWFVELHFEALNLASWSLPSWFLKPEVTIFGQESRADKETDCTDTDCIQTDFIKPIKQRNT